MPAPNTRTAKKRTVKEGRFGAPVTDYGIGLETRRAGLEGLKRRGEESEDSVATHRNLDIDKEMQKYSALHAPTLLADEKSILKKKRKKSSSDRRIGGRLSTILSDTLG